jgi:hypothetical protein
MKFVKVLAFYVIGFMWWECHVILSGSRVCGILVYIFVMPNEQIWLFLYYEESLLKN